ncbi:MAG: hypothetical protein ACRCT2_08745, partial [Plesiomonas shigelloides]
EPKGLHISAVNVELKDDSGAPIEDRYYDSREYAKLSDEQRHNLKELRTARGQVSGSGKKPQGKAKGKAKGKAHKAGGRGYKKSIDRMTKHVIAAVASQFKKGKDDDGASSDDDGGDNATGGNRKHPALQRQKSKSK